MQTMESGHFHLGLSVVFILSLGSNWKADCIPLLDQPVEDAESTTLNPIQPPSNNDEKIQLCGDHLREMIKYVCKHHGSTQPQYYTPAEQIEQLSTGDDQQSLLSAVENSDVMDNDIMGRRSRRQVVRECCDKPCLKRDLLKYCILRKPATSTENSIHHSSGSGNARNSHRRRRVERQRWKYENLTPAMDMSDNEIQKDEPVQPKSAPCRCQNKNRRKRAVITMNSDEGDSAYENNDLYPHYRRNQRNEQLRSLVRMVTDSPFPEDPIAFPRGTNDQ